MHSLRGRPRNRKKDKSSTILRSSPLEFTYAECSAKRNRGVLEAFTEASRVALTARAVGGDLPRREEKKKARRCFIL